MYLLGMENIKILRSKANQSNGESRYYIHGLIQINCLIIFQSQIQF